MGTLCACEGRSGYLRGQYGEDALAYPPRDAADFCVALFVPVCMREVTFTCAHQTEGQLQLDN